MMERMTYTNEKGMAVEFSASSVYHANHVIGVCDTRNTVFTVQSMGQDGDTYVGGRIDRREIEITGSIREPDKARAFELRRQMSRALNPQLSATLTYRFGDTVRIIDCVPDSAPIYSRSAVLLDYAVSLICHNPFWREENEQAAQIAAWVGDWEFPFDIPEDTGMEFGHREPSLIVTVTNRGDVRTGMRVVFRAVGDLTDPSLLNINTSEYIKLTTNMAAGDVIIVTTHYGRKRVIQRRGGVTSDALYLLDPDSVFLTLDVGDNQFRYDAGANIQNLEVTLFFSHQYLSP